VLKSVISNPFYVLGTLLHTENNSRPIIMLQFNARQSSLMQALIYFIKVVCIITLKFATAATIYSLLLMVGRTFYKVLFVNPLSCLKQSVTCR